MCGYDNSLIQKLEIIIHIKLIETLDSSKLILSIDIVMFEKNKNKG